MKLPALAVSALGLLLVVIGLMFPLWTASWTFNSIAFTQKLYIKDQKTEVPAIGFSQTTDTWDCDSDCEIPDSHKAGFAMLFIGMVANVACLISLVSANNFATIPAPMGQKMPTVGLASVSTFFYFLGTVIAVPAAPQHDKIDARKDAHVIGIGSILIIIGLVSAVAAVGLSFMGIDDVDAPAVSIAKVVPDVEAPPAAAEAPAAEEKAAQ